MSMDDEQRHDESQEKFTEPVSREDLNGRRIELNPSAYAILDYIHNGGNDMPFIDYRGALNTHDDATKDDLPARLPHLYQEALETEADDMAQDIADLHDSSGEEQDEIARELANIMAKKQLDQMTLQDRLATIRGNFKEAFELAVRELAEQYTYPEDMPADVKRRLSLVQAAVNQRPEL